MTRLKKEIEFYDGFEVSDATSEIEVWDSVIFPNVIRKRELGLILSQLEKVKPERILDFGCGAGWLSRFLSTRGYHVTGIDASGALIKSAVQSSSEMPGMVVGDCLGLPFRDASFDFIVGMAIFHHLDADEAFRECWRVSTPGAKLLLMEPNKLNPVAFVGRKITNVQTEDENPFSPGQLVNTLIKTGWFIEEIKYFFPYSFGLSYLLKNLSLRQQIFRSISFLVANSEKLLEKIPWLNRLSGMICVVATKED
jgi:SAM-dependent methyltransferase